MSEDLSIQGTLAETTVPDLFRSLVRSGETAIVSLEGIGRNDAVYFETGRIISATSSDPDLGLAEVLLRSGDLDLGQYRTAMEKLAASRQVGSLLCQLGFLNPDELTHALEQQTRAIVHNVMRYRAGSYTIEFTSSMPEGVIAIPTPTERLILDGIRRIEFWSLIERGIGRLNRRIELVPGSDTRSYSLELTDEETHILDLLSTPQTVESVCAQSYLPNFVTCRTLWGLLVVNLLQDAEETAVDEKRAAEANQYELEEIVERYNTAFQAIFEMVFQRIGDHVYDFMDRVVLHLSPETLPYLSGMNMVNEGRVDFDQLLTNLIASGSHDHTPIVHNVLNELLYGWIFEIRTEFGGALEKEAVGVVEGLKR
jgi:hypothetical protein